MSKWDETAIKHHLQNELDHQPDYNSMWRRIEREAEERSSGWNKEHIIQESKSMPIQSKVKRLIITAGAAAVIGIGGFAWQILQQQSDVSAVKQASVSESGVIELARNSAIQQIHLPITNEDGIGIQINTVQLELQPYSSLAKLNLNLLGVDTSTFDYAGFNKAALIDTHDDSAKQIISSGFLKENRFYANTSIMLEKSKQGNESKPFVLKLTDLYLTKRHEVPLPGPIQLNKEYTLDTEQKTKISIQKYDWSDDNQKLTILYTMNKNPFDIAGNKEALSATFKTTNNLSLQSDRSKRITEVRGQTIALEKNGVRQEFDFESPLTEQDKDSLKLNFEYSTLVKKVDGVWRVPLVIEP